MREGRSRLDASKMGVIRLGGWVSVPQGKSMIPSTLMGESTDTAGQWDWCWSVRVGVDSSYVSQRCWRAAGLRVPGVPH